jgi:Guanylate-binding protein, N-terminal domain
VLLSSLFVYNQMGGIDEAALDRLSLVTEVRQDTWLGVYDAVLRRPRLLTFGSFMPLSTSSRLTGHEAHPRAGGQHRR